MKINKYWILEDDLYPFLISEDEWRAPPANKEIFDSVAIYHKPRKENFRPIVFGEYKIISEDEWTIRDFYVGLLLCEKVLNSESSEGVSASNSHRWAITKRSDGNTYWGCREFTKADIKTMKKLMEQEYTKKQLGIK